MKSQHGGFCLRDFCPEASIPLSDKKQPSQVAPTASILPFFSLFSFSLFFLTFFISSKYENIVAATSLAMFKARLNDFDLARFTVVF